MRRPNVEKMKAKKDVEGLIKALEYMEDAYVRHEAAWALGEIGKPAVESLIRALGNEELHVREGAAIALGLTKDARAVEPLIHILKGEYEVQDPYGITTLGEVQMAAISALGYIKDARAVEPLIQALKDEFLREYAVMALGEIGDARAIEPLTQIDKEDESWEVQWRAREALDKIKAKGS